MKSFIAPVAAALLLAGNAVAQLTINTPLNVVVCQPLLITWSGGTPPYFLSILPGNQPSAPAVLDFGTVTGTSLTWTVNITAGTSLGLDLRDSTGTLAQSAAFTIQSSTNTACLNAPPPSTGSSSAPATSGSTTAVTTPPVSTPPATSKPVTTPPPTTTPLTTPTTTPGSSSTASKPPATSSTKSSSAGPAANVGLAGILGVGAALVALLA